MVIRTEFRLAGFGALLEDLPRRLAFAGVATLNKTALRFQRHMREEADRVFEVRRRDFVLRQIAVIQPFASVPQGRLYVEIYIGRRSKLLLSMFERGGVRAPMTAGATRVAVPITGGAARPSFSDQVTPTLRYKALRLRRRDRRRDSHAVPQGLERTYLIPGTGIFQRVSPTVTLQIFSLEEAPPIPRRLDFHGDAKLYLPRWVREEGEREYAEALRRAGRS